TPPLVLEAARRALDERPMSYTAALGLDELRTAIARHYQERFGVRIDPARVVPTAGSSAALLLTLSALLDEGQEVLQADPSYPCNRHIARSLGITSRAVPVGPERGFQLDAELASAAWSERVGAILVGSPANPTATLVPRAVLGGLADLARERGASLIVDELYQGLVYEGADYTALECADDAFVISGFSKYFQMTGFRLGWLVAPPEYVRPIERLAQNLYIAPSTLAQYAALAAFEPATLELLEARRRELDERRLYLLERLPQLGFAVPARPQGAFYVYADASQLASDSFELCRRLLEEAHVALTPGRDFGRVGCERWVRFAYTQPLGRLREACERLERALS
ncbi:MAG TPA: aminotransferase class I/II-fold pyridoxal phosphate-dependent enzyme, partial [Polyangiaceae bacterium]|nr:aminotransferase class I/II-fold pyridoxal phosphate-dependent enzyme [Polyangiaceae bacterium]